MRIICAAPSQKEWNAHIKSIKSREFNVLTAADILDMDDFEVKLLMLYNPQFFALAIEALGSYIGLFLDEIREWDDSLTTISSLDELLTDCDYFGNDFEGRRREFITVFLDCLWDYASPSER